MKRRSSTSVDDQTQVRGPPCQPSPASLQAPDLAHDVWAVGGQPGSGACTAARVTTHLGAECGGVVCTCARARCEYQGLRRTLPTTDAAASGDSGRPGRQLGACTVAVLVSVRALCPGGVGVGLGDQTTRNARR